MSEKLPMTPAEEYMSGVISDLQIEVKRLKARLNPKKRRRMLGWWAFDRKSNRPIFGAEGSTRKRAMELGVMQGWKRKDIKPHKCIISFPGLPPKRKTYTKSK